MSNSKVTSILALSGYQDSAKPSDHVVDNGAPLAGSKKLSNDGPASTSAAISTATISAPQSPDPGGIQPFTHEQNTPVHPSATQEPKQTYIVFLDASPGNGGFTQRAEGILRSLNIKNEPRVTFDRLNGFALDLTEQDAQRLRALNGVASVEADAAVSLEPRLRETQQDLITGQALTKFTNATANGETAPWGVRAVWQGRDLSTLDASTTYAFVIDSGVNDKITDLNIATNSGLHRSWITGQTAFTDGNGHGTHVSGTIGAKLDGKGVIGVAPGAQIVSLKVFDSTGGGGSYLSIIDAINHAVKTTQDLLGNKTSSVVINMSLGGGYSSSLDAAVKSAASQGFRFALAAGNSGRDADSFSPAAAGDDANVFTISAVDSNYRMASFSNWDKLTTRDNIDDVDFGAPGVGVLSYNGSTGALEAWNGTSMAAPHAAGLILMGGIRSGGMTTPYFSGTADPFAIGIG